MRKRISSVTFSDIYNVSANVYDHATHYSYDIHGNVKSLLQDNNNPDVVTLGQQFKRIDYTYDLISGNVHKVDYQNNEPDQWHHRYEYDADNRIKKVETSRDNMLWDLDAKYFYYAHGPLARTEIGDLKVQGMDYAYTLQGWVKGVNSETLNETRDMGKDGETTSINKLIARDAMGYSLGYFDKDYFAIDTNKNLPANNFLASKIDPTTQTNSDLLNARNDLFNGNIGMMVTTITPPTLQNNAVVYSPLPQGTAYKYDQLNRLMEMQAYQNIDAVNNIWGNSGGYAGMYFNQYTYDANGNIETALAKNLLGQDIDNQIYHYQTNQTTGAKLSNRLYTIEDNAQQTSGEDLPSGQIAFDNTPATINTANNYSYDKIGNLKSDKQAQIQEIKWTVSGKIKEVTREGGSAKRNLKFDYDASNKRIAKHVFDSNENWLRSEFYIRDAQGNLLSVYEQKTKNNLMSYAQTEKHIYGSSSVGIEKTETEMIGSPPVSANNFIHTLGNKNYNGSNHLGNVLSVFTDRKFPVDADGDFLVDYYLPDVIAANDYAPFGGLLAERTFNKNTFPNSFNGKRNDRELDDWQDYGERMYSPWMRRFPTVDPISGNYPELSTYQFASNTPIVALDIDGLEAWVNKANQLIFGPYSPQYVSENNLKSLGEIATSFELYNNIIEGATKSTLFATLLNEADIFNGVTIRSSNVTSTQEIYDDEKGTVVETRINIKTTEEKGGNIRKLAWELTNTKHTKEGSFTQLDGDIIFSGITKEQYVKGKMALESEAAFNTHLVSTQLELNYGFSDASLQKYNSMSSQEFQKQKESFIADYTNWSYENAVVTTKQGKELARDVYGKDYEEIKSQSKKPPTEGEKKDK